MLTEQQFYELYQLYQSGSRLEPAQLEALEPYKVHNAVIMAAGMSSRFAPLSYERPKGLLRVKGEVLIEREIRQLQKAGITDITVVVGYMKEKFFYLEDKMNVKIVVNDDYFRYNNTSTLLRVLGQLSNTYICSSDDYFVDNVFEPYVYKSYYAAAYAKGKTDEYCLTADEAGKITNVSIGGSDSWYMIGHVYFDQMFSRKFADILTREYEQEITRQELWENLYMRHMDELELYIRRYDAGVIWEFDSLEELRNFDEEYINNADSEILQNICRVLHCEIKDITDIAAIKKGLTNTSFSFRINGCGYVYRHPGKGTEEYINRRSEAFSMKIAERLKLDETFIYMDETDGWKISRYIEGARELDYHNKEDVQKAIVMMQKLHKEAVHSEYDFLIWERALEFAERLMKTEKADYEEFDKLYQMMQQVSKKTKEDQVLHILCHCDCYSPNFLLDNDNNMYLIDWEYSGNDDPASDLGTFICCSDYTYEESLQIIRMYLEHEPDKHELAHYVAYVAIASYYWYLWALYQESMGKSVGKFLYIWYKNTKRFAKEALILYE